MEFKILETRLGSLEPIERGELTFKPSFGYGSKKDLMAYLRAERKTGDSFYPIVWLMTPFQTRGNYFRHGRSEATIDIVIATLTNRDISNPERVRLTFENTLEPLLDNVVRSLSFGGNTGLVEDEPFLVEKYFNYDTDSSNAVSDVWDAITLRCSIKFKYSC